MLAKLCSSMNKPDKQTVIMDSHIETFVKTLSLTRIPGLGGKLGKQLECEYNAKFSSNLHDIALPVFQSNFGDVNGSWIYNICRGICHKPVQKQQPPKTQTSHKLLSTPVANEIIAERWLNTLSAELYLRIMADSVENERWSSRIQLQVKSLRCSTTIVKSSMMLPKIGLTVDKLSKKVWSLFCVDMFPIIDILLICSLFTKNDNGTLDIFFKNPLLDASEAAKEMFVNDTKSEHLVTKKRKIMKTKGVFDKWLNQDMINGFHDNLFEEQDNGMICKKCIKRKFILSEDIQEHEDYHFAVDLHEKIASSINSNQIQLPSSSCISPNKRNIDENVEKQNEIIDSKESILKWLQKYSVPKYNDDTIAICPEGFIKCSKCEPPKLVPIKDIHIHADFHFALELHYEHDNISVLATSKKDKVKKNDNQKLTNFFKRI
jgi:hypothetical protein